MTPRRDIVHTAADLEACWRRLIEPLGFASRQVFAILIDRDGEVFRSVIHVTECPHDPDDEMVTHLAEALRAALDQADPQGSCAVVWARPTHAGTRASDLEWVRAFAGALDAVGLGRWPVHVADDHVMRAVGPDDLAA